MRSLLGGKGANVAEMLAHRRARPRRLHGHDRGLRRGDARRRLARRAGGRDRGRGWSRSRSAPAASSATGARPLLVSVRSGAVHSMPGMMDTILNLGMSEATAEALAAESGNARFAWDSYRRFVQMYGEVVEGVPGDVYEHALTPQEVASAASAADTDLDGRRPARPGRRVPAAHRRARRHAARRPARAAARRRRRGVPLVGQPARDASTGGRTASPTTSARPSTSCRWCSATSATTPATGVCFTRNPSTGEREGFGEFLVNAQGEDVVAGIRTPRPLPELRGRAARLLRAADRDDGAARGATTATCRTSSSRSSAARSTCCRRAPASAPTQAALHIARDLVGRGRDRARGGRRPHRPARPRPAAAPDASTPSAAASRWCAA